ncbi:MAG: fumarylacetoacetate hydrolase family protein [Gemmatimonadota bacterium]|uniref:fumarylacetoacetate hydrolase family protein n=1 Tax=Candidatus Palauibacter scopulicola TaxID=3056741 RepID=UPI0023865934|nr:fumarylacetoacetate hydrolase family protein [Candidatus Palauibacter scopulicola]MDE2664222.1 fumarylacetoacetate hydrolase family protein [Candidatus Palauibacter scopulicola]
MTAYVRYLAPGATEHGDAAASGNGGGRWGVVEDEVLADGTIEDGMVEELAAPPFRGEVRTGSRMRLDELHLLAPATPSKVIAVGLNYRSHLDNSPIGTRPEPTVPPLFAKLPSSIVGPDAAIEIPPDAEVVHAEGEVVVVIGRAARHVSPEEAGDRVFGVTAGNDVSERVWQRDDLQWLRAKGSDSFGPLGPRIVTGAAWEDLRLRTRLNGEVVQDARTSDLIFSIPEIIAYASRYFTLLPGDVIYTGTPGKTSAISAGDRVEVEVEGVGVLANDVKVEAPKDRT